VSAGGCVHQRPGGHHYLFDYSPDMECLEVAGPGDLSIVDIEPVYEVPSSEGWGA
jgi:hypothetical protein